MVGSGRLYNQPAVGHRAFYAAAFFRFRSASDRGRRARLYAAGGLRPVCAPHEAVVLQRNAPAARLDAPERLRRGPRAALRRAGGYASVPGDCAFITSGICEIELEINSSRAHRAELADAAAEMLLIRLSRACSSAAEARAVNPELGALLHRFRSGLFARLGEAWTVERMAEEMHMSPSRFYALYKAQFDVSPMNDLIQARIDAAKSALTGQDISISEVAERLGYANATHFSRQFRQRTGISPRGYAHK